MATIHTILTPDGRHIPFTGGTDAQRLAQGAARGETRFFESTASNWPAPGGGNNSSLAITFDLDAAYAWIITDISAVFISPTTDNLSMDAVGMLEFKLPTSGGSEYVYTHLAAPPSRQGPTGSTAIGSLEAREYNSQHPLVDSSNLSSMTFVAETLPTYLMYPFDSVKNAVEVTAIFSQAPSDTSAITCRFAARCLQYDINQAYDYRVQSPQLMR
jgi:hypothetical protein